MNRRERRYGRMYLLPLLLALTGLALLPLEWVLRLSGFDAFGDLAQTVIYNCLCVAYPLVLMFLFVFRVPPKVARIFAFVSLALALAQLIVVLYCNKNAPHDLLLWIPGHMLLPHINALKEVKNAQNVLLTASDACFVLSTLSAVGTCLIYAAVKIRSDKRNAEFDRRNAYLKNGGKPPVEEPAPEKRTRTKAAQSTPAKGRRTHSTASSNRVMSVPDDE